MEGPPPPLGDPPARPPSSSPPPASVLRFRVAYPTTWGQCLAVLGAPSLLGAWDPARAARMACRHEPTGGSTSRLVWETAVALPGGDATAADGAAAASVVEYKYVVLGEDGRVVEAEPEARAVPLPPGGQGEGGGGGSAPHTPQVVILADAWAGGAPPASLLGRAAFTRAILRPAAAPAVPPSDAAAPTLPTPTPPSTPPAPAPGTVLLRLSVRAWGLAPGEAVVAAGSAPALGSWRLGSALRLKRAQGGGAGAAPRWEAAVAVPAAHFPLTFRFAVAPAPSLDGDGAPMGEPVEPRLEAGENRVAALDAWSAAGPAAVSEDGGTPRGGATPGATPPRPAPPSLLSIDGGSLRPDRPWRGGGLAVPLFSVRSRAGLGTGEFADIPALAAWAAAAGLSLLQLLPVNDTGVTGTWEDSYPYSALSVFALHPLYVDVEGLGPVVEGGGGGPSPPRRLPGPPTAPLPPHLAARAASARARLNALPALDYEAVMAEKLAIARAVFDDTGRVEVETSDDYQAFLHDNAGWLRPYAAHAVCRALFGSPDHWTWGALATPTPADFDRLCSPDADFAPTVRFTWWLQWKAHAQLAAAAAAAARHRVALKGDLPIGVDRRGVDAWAHPALFRMATSTGAPPDYFDKKGQAWGFPTYDWGAAAGERYAWWAARLCHLARYFSALRIDHILGFFRIWELPPGATTGILGRFRPGKGITRAELEAEGMWDVDRLADPFITPGHAAVALAGGGGPAAVERFTVPGPCEGRLALAPSVWREEDIERVEAAVGEEEAGDGGGGVGPAAAAATTTTATTAALRAGLLSLRQNLLLVRDGDDPAGTFHPRIGLAETQSFAALEASHPAWAARLRDLHDAYFRSDAQDGAWAAHARAVLPPLLSATDMLICGEDLGMVPACVGGVLEGLGVLGLRVQRMPAEAGAEFGDPASYPYLAVASPSTHDTPPLRAWWEDATGADRRARFWAWAGLGRAGEAPPPTCTPALAAAVLRAHAASPAMLCVLALQDLLALCPAGQARPSAEETINDPTVRKHYWRYRCQVAVEELRGDPGLTGAVRALMVEGGRAVPPVPAAEEGVMGSVGVASLAASPVQASLENDLAVLTLEAAC